MSKLRFVSLMFSKQVFPRAIKVALLVGTLLALINHGDKILSISLTNQDYIKLALTYFVPYAVSSWSAASAIMSNKGPSAES